MKDKFTKKINLETKKITFFPEPDGQTDVHQ